ncbi:MAG: hypothetical protein NUV51_03995 [Sulfuricaulis sp.]|nr:hypothetical protein [Sulfuricaulis sp.]
MSAQTIRTKSDRSCLLSNRLEISGWLSSRRGTYLWFGLDGKCIGTLSGARLYRLAKAIVRRFEERT